MDTHTHKHAHTHDRLIAMIMKISRRFGKETFVNFYQKTILLFNISFFAFLYAWFLSTPEGLDLHWDPPSLLLSRYQGGWSVWGVNFWPFPSTYYQRFKIDWSYKLISPIRLHGVQRGFSTSYKHSLNMHWLHMHTHNDWSEGKCTTTLYVSGLPYCSLKLCLKYTD